MGQGIERKNGSEAEHGLAGLTVGNQKARCQDQCNEPAGITDRPTETAQSAQLMGRHQTRHHRVRENGCDFSGHAGDHYGCSDRQEHRRLARLRQPQNGHSQDEYDGRDGNPGFASS